ncbi:TPA: hypothetical protein P0E12_004989 [Vibrio harveyi]|nr:hypothetical protein [Vibrio harveyi]
MAKILLDYAVSFSEVNSTTKASLAYLHNLCVVVTPADPENAGTVVEITTPEQIALYVEDKGSQLTDLESIFNGGLRKFSLALVEAGGDIDAVIKGQEGKYFTVYLGDQFALAENLQGLEWKGVKAATLSKDETDKQPTVQLEKNCCVFPAAATESTSAAGGLFAFSSLLSSSNWRNQQYIQAIGGVSQSVNVLGTAESYFENRYSFYINDDEQGTRLAFFVAGGKSITTPYIQEELHVVIQSSILSFLSTNQPFNVETSRRLLEQRANRIIVDYVEDSLLDPDGDNEVKIEKSNEAFIVKGQIYTTESEALWRVDIDAFNSAV